MDNLRGILLMIASMAAFALEDMFVKHVSGDVPVGQILFVLGTCGGFLFAGLIRRQGARFWTRELLSRPVMIRNFGELFGTFCFVSAITLTPISSASAIIQATPLAVTLGAALFLRETVGWRRWSAICVGFLGVLMVVRPGLAAFEPNSLYAVGAVFGLGTRDLATRATPPRVGAMQLSSYAFFVTAMMGLALMLSGQPPVALSPYHIGHLAGALLFGTCGYYTIVTAMRLGEISVVTPFRYTRLIFALVIGILVFGERPDIWTLTGSGVIILSGLYTIAREQKRRRQALTGQAAAQKG